MRKEYIDVISEAVGVEPIQMMFLHNVSAQSRKLRLYWTNIPEAVTPPKDNRHFITRV